MSRTRAIWLAVVFSLLAPALHAAGRVEAPAPVPVQVRAQAGFPVTVTDDGGTILTLPGKPARIVSLTLFTDEMLVNLVDTGRLIGVTTFAADQDISNVAAAAAVIPGKLTLAVEPILSLTPDLVFVADWSEADKVKQLRDAGAAVYVIAAGASVAEIQDRIRDVAALVGEGERGERMIADMDARLADVARRTSALEAAERVRVLDYAVWGAAQGQGSSWDVVVLAAGLVNAVGDLAADLYGQVALSKEKLIEIDPDLLILPGWIYGDPKGAESFFQQTLNDPALRDMRAVRAGRVYQMPERLKSTVSQYVAEAVEYLAKTAYPDLFR